MPSAPTTIAEASRSKSVPVVVRTSQPRPTMTAVRPGASLVSETLPPLVRLTLTTALHLSREVVSPLVRAERGRAYSDNLGALPTVATACPPVGFPMRTPAGNCRWAVLHSAPMSPASRTAAAAPPVPSSTGRRLLLLDGHSLAYRAFFALPAENFRTGTGQTTNAVYGFTAMLINLLRDEQPTHLAVCFDVSRQTFRSERYTEYKANRTTTPDDFRGQVDLIKEVLRALAIPEFGVAGFEADDLIATLATQAEVDGFQVLITSGDRDAFQLVSDNVTVLYPTRGVSELGRIDPDAVMARYGLTPAQYPDFAALRGDPSDNLPSIPGVGEKTAAKWVREFGSLAELTDRVDEVKGKAGDALRAHLAGVVLNRQLTELVRDVPLDARPEDLAVRPWDRDAVHRLFDELEFRVLRERLFATLQSAEPEAEGGIEVQGGAIPAGGLRAWLDEHARDGRRVGLAFHGVVGTAAAADLTGIGLATGEPSVEARAAGAAAGLPQAGYVEVAALTPDDEAALGEWLADPAVPKAAHDAKAAMHALRGRGWSLAGAHQRHRAGRLPHPARPAQLRPRRSHPPLPAPRAAAGQRGRGRPALVARRRGGGRGGAGHHADGRGVGGGGAGRCARRRAGREGGQRAARRAGAAARVRAGRSGDGGHRRRPRPAVLARGRVRGAGEAGRAGRLLGDRQGDQPRLAEAAAGRAVRRARTCPRPSAPRPATPPMRMRCRPSTSRPGTSSSPTCSSTATPPGSRSPSRAC